MKAQKDVFRETEANAWLERNRAGLLQYSADKDVVVQLLRPLLRSGMHIAEVGCCLAGRLAALTQDSSTQGFGIDPSTLAIEEANQHHPALSLQQGTAELLPWADHSMDVLIYGFCLYLCDRSDLFRIASEGDRVLKNGGLLVVLDFLPPQAHRNGYTHQPGLFSYKMDYSRLWTWNPAYTAIALKVFDHSKLHASDEAGLAPDERIAVSILKKSQSHAYPLSPSYGTP